MKIVSKIVEELVLLVFTILLSYISYKFDSFNVMIIYMLLRIWVEQIKE